MSGQDYQSQLNTVRERLAPYAYYPRARYSDLADPQRLAAIVADPVKPKFPEREGGA